MTNPITTIDDVRNAETVIREHISPAPLIRSYELEKVLGLPRHRRVWLKDYGWTPVGSFKLTGTGEMALQKKATESVTDRLPLIRPATSHLESRSPDNGMENMSSS